MPQVNNRIILITGGASGLGKEMAFQLGNAGGTIILWDINSNGLAQAAEEFSGHDINIYTAVCDVSSADMVKREAAKLLEQHGQMDILINNAGVVSGKPFWETPDDLLRNNVAVNFEALFWVTKAFLPEMIRRNQGHIVTISSAAGLIGTPMLTDYSATKSAAFGFDESLRMEFRKRDLDIKTTVVCPYFIKTGMFAGVRTRFPWLLPILDEKKVAKKIVTAIEKNRPRLLIPKIVYIVWLLRYLPVRWFDNIAAFLGLSSTMDRFTGRSDISSQGD